MADGAHQGVSATRALRTILGGEEPPTAEEEHTPQEVLARVLSAPLPGEGAPPYQRGGASDHAYGMVCDSIARCFLVLEGEDPGLLDRKIVYPQDYEIPEWRGMVMSPETVAWQALMARWPDADEWYGGCTGFQVGFAFNTARFVTGRGPVGNPAIVTVEVPDGDA